MSLEFPFFPGNCLSRFVNRSNIKFEQDILGRTNCLLSSHYISSIWYDIECIENTESSSSSIIVGAFTAMRACSQCCCLATLEEEHRQQGDLIHRLLFFQNKKIRLKMYGFNTHNYTVFSKCSKYDGWDFPTLRVLEYLSHNQKLNSFLYT
jgi:hypothetical protein